MPIIGVIASSGDRNVPDAPTIGTATNVPSGRPYNNGRADVTFTAPVYTGGTPITGYTVTSSPGGFTGTGASSPISVTGLQSGVSYTFTVTATNAVGTGPASAASNSITATTVPQAPTIGTATDLGTGTSVSVAFTAGATGGSAITGFTATSSPSSITGTGGSSPITVSGLTSGTAYTFTVTATNANGTSAASAASNSVTPAVPITYDYDLLATSTTSGTNLISFTGLPSTYNTFIVRASYSSAVEGYSFVAARFNGLTANYKYNNNLVIFDGSSTTVSAFGVTNSGSGVVANQSLSGTSTPCYSEWVISGAQTTGRKSITGRTGSWRRAYNGANSDGFGIVSGTNTGSTAAITSIQILFDYNINNTNIKLYGVK